MQPNETTLHERICRWIQSEYPAHNAEGRALVFTSAACTHMTALSHIITPLDVGEGVVYSGHDAYPCDLISPVQTYRDDLPTTLTGGRHFHFRDGENSFDVLLVSAWITDDDINSTMINIASVPPRSRCPCQQR